MAEKLSDLWGIQSEDGKLWSENIPPVNPRTYHFAAADDESSSPCSWWTERGATLAMHTVQNKALGQTCKVVNLPRGHGGKR